MNEVIEKDLFAICQEIEDGCSKIAGISGVFSDFWLVSLSDWAQDDKQEEEMLQWITQRYGLGVNIDHLSFDKDSLQQVVSLDPLGCFFKERLMLIAVYVLIHRTK